MWSLAGTGGLHWGTPRVPLGHPPCPSGVRTVSQRGTHRVQCSFLKGIEWANLVRREQLAFIASQAYSFGQLARSPVNADLAPQVEEIKRLKTHAPQEGAADS